MTTAYYLHAEGLIIPDAECPDSACMPQLVAVIPVEDREQVERLLSRYLSIYDGMDAVPSAGEIASMQAALREFANPTPSEPTDVCAVVTDRRQNTWRLLADGDWICTSGPDHGEYLTWSRLASERGPLEVPS